MLTCLYDVVGYALLGSMCLCIYFHDICGCVITPDAHEALFGCNHLGCITMMPIASCIPFSFAAPCNDMLVCAIRWLYVHLYTLTYMSIHESCLLVCHSYFNTMKLWTPDPNLHLSLVDTTFCLLSFLFALSLVCFLACLPSRLFACILVPMLAMSVTFVYFMPLPYAFCTFFFPLLVS